MKNIPQILMLILIFVSLLMSANNHGKDKKGKDDFWISFMAMLILITILYCGHFFDNFLK